MLSTIIFRVVNPFAFVDPFTVSAITTLQRERQKKERQKKAGGGERDCTYMSIASVKAAHTNERKCKNQLNCDFK
jgi:hypothetical protein